MGEGSTRAARWVRNQGFKLPEEPGYQLPNLPSDITAENEKDLMVLFAEISSWLDFMEVQFVAAQIDEKQNENELEKIAAIEQIKHKGEKTVTLSKAQVFANNSYTEQRERVFTAFSHRKMLEVIYNSLERKRFVVSREITRRQHGN